MHGVSEELPGLGLRLVSTLSSVTGTRVAQTACFVLWALSGACADGGSGAPSTPGRAGEVLIVREGGQGVELIDGCWATLSLVQNQDQAIWLRTCPGRAELGFTMSIGECLVLASGLYCLYGLDTDEASATLGIRYGLDQTRVRLTPKP